MPPQGNNNVATELLQHRDAPEQKVVAARQRAGDPTVAKHPASHAEELMAFDF
jgi:hypothetical protein